jgi:hypothetical protein
MRRYVSGLAVLAVLASLFAGPASYASAISLTFPTITTVFDAGSFQSVATKTGVTPAISGGTGGSLRVIVSASNSGLVRLATTTGISASTSYNLSQFNASSNGLGTISFEGSVTNVSNALASLEFNRSTAGDSVLTVDVTEGSGLVFDNRYYEVINAGSAISWADAYRNALSKAVDAQGGGAKCQGYLATITSLNEQTFAFDKVRTQSWIALSDQVNYVNTAIASYNISNNPDLTTYADQAAVEGKFHWVAGPERGTQVTTGNTAGGSTPLVAGQFAYWNAMEPNNWPGGASGDEHATQMLSDGRWNDLKHDTTSAFITTYIVEYGGIRVTGSHQTNPASVDITNQNHLGTKESCTPALAAASASQSFTASAVAVVPTAPRSLSATAGNQSAALTWSAPVSNGGSTITGYRIDVSTDGGSTFTTSVANTGSSSTSRTISGLTVGTSYIFRAFAINAIGTSSASNDTSSLTAISHPGAPTGLSAVAGVQSVSLSWTAPASNGGASITAYRIDISTNNGSSYTTQVMNTGSTSTTASISGLTGGTAYVFRVAAINSLGVGSYSDPSASATATSAPGAPTSVAGTATGDNIALSWTAPASNGGSAITGYKIEISSDNGSTWTTVNANTGSSATSATISQLATGSYRFRVSAINGIGTSVVSTASTAVSVTATSPGLPINLSISHNGFGSAIVAWDAPASDGGSAITGYVVEYQIGGAWLALTPSGLSAAVSNVWSTQGWSFRVAAVNAVGTGSFAVFTHVPPPPFTGPIISSFSRTEIPAGKPTPIVLEGLRLNQVAEVWIANQKLQFTIDAPGKITLQLPALSVGSHNLRLIYSEGAVLIHQDAIRVSTSQIPAAGSLRFTGFSGNSFVLPQSSRLQIAQALSGVPDAVKVVCIGFTSGTRATAGDRRLALRRAQEACNYAKQLVPNLEADLRANPAAGVGARFRGVAIEIFTR